MNDFESYSKTLSEYGIPGHMHGGIYNYIFMKIEPGSFLLNILCNDLVGAAGCADHVNERCLKNYAVWLYSNAPRGCWGSPEKVKNWLKG